MTTITDEMYREAARNEYLSSDGDIDIDQDATVSVVESPKGAWVQAWVWVSDSEVLPEEYLEEEGKK